MNPDNLMDGYDINQSEFPFLNKQNVQKTVTQFNYNVWGAKTRLYFKHVPASWASDYEHVVCFPDKQTRDAYFKDAEPKVLETEFRIPHDGVVRLPYPYDEIINFNYLVAEYPQIPVPDGNLGPHRLDYFYFIEDCDYISPNCTEVKITLDVWTTYINDIDVNNMTLERGHYAVANAADVDTYLANPLNNRLFIGTADVSFGELCKISKNNVYKLNEGNAYVVVATYSDVFNPEYHEPILNTGFGVEVDENPERETYSTYCYHGTGADYEKGVDYFAVDWSKWGDFCEFMRDHFPAFFQTIQGCLVITDKYIPVNRSFVRYLPFDSNETIPLYTIIGGITQAIDYSFTQADFGYSDKYNWLTKLYTYPYAAVEYIDQNGNSNTIKYEDLAVGKFAANIYSNLCIGAPKARFIIFHVGAGGINGDFDMHAIDIPVPTTPIHLNQYENYIVHTRHSRTQTLDSIQTGYTNAEDSADVGKTNANKSSATAKENADDSALAGKTSADNSADLANTISSRGNEQAKDFATKNITTSENYNNKSIEYTKKIALVNNQVMVADAFVNVSNEQAQAILKGVSRGINSIGTIPMAAAGTLLGVASGGSAALIPAIASTISSVNTNIIQNSYTAENAKDMWDISKYITSIALDNAIAKSIMLNGTLKDPSNIPKLRFKTVDHKVDYPFDWWDEKYDGLTYDYYMGGDYVEAKQLEAVEGLNNEQSKALFNINKTNAEQQRNAAYTTAEDNRKDTLNLTKDNNKRSYDTATGNNTRSKTTADAIALNARNLASRINSANKTLGVHGVNNAVRQSKFDNMFTAGTPGDVSGWGYLRAKIQYHIKTQDADSIAKAGDYFLKYGYKYDGIINFTGFNIMNHFTYWKCSDIWLDSTSVNNNIVKQIRAILMNGVTVWRNPSDLGAINIYNNRVAV